MAGSCGCPVVVPVFVPVNDLAGDRSSQPRPVARRHRRWHAGGRSLPSYHRPSPLPLSAVHHRVRGSAPRPSEVVRNPTWTSRRLAGRLPRNPREVAIDAAAGLVGSVGCEGCSIRSEPNGGRVRGQEPCVPRGRQDRDGPRRRQDGRRHRVAGSHHGDGHRQWSD